MSDILFYICETCGRRQKVEDKASVILSCHNKLMKPVNPLPECEITMTAEHARFNDYGDPCDDNRGGPLQPT